MSEKTQKCENLIGAFIIYKHGMHISNETYNIYSVDEYTNLQHTHTHTHIYIYIYIYRM